MTDAAAGKPLAQAAESRRRAALARVWADFSQDRVATAALAVLAVLLALAFASPWIAPTNPYDLARIDILDSRLPPGSVGGDGTRFLLGTDGQGRDLLSAILYGLRLSILVGVLSGTLAGIFGTAIGLVAGYVGGRFDAFVMRLVDLQLGFPAILVALILLAALGRGIDKVVIALVAVQWAYYCRTVRSSALVEKTREYVEAAQCLGLGSRRIVFRHLLPNCLAPVIVLGTVQIANSVALEATLSFLGLGLPPTEPSLGLLIANGFDFMLSGQYWISFYPGVALIVLILCINLVGDQLRDVLNPRLQR